MSFAQQTSSFFDELARIQEEQKGARDQHMGERHPSGPGPYSNMLTQDETPSDWRPIHEFPNYLEPEIIVRGLP